MEIITTIGGIAGSVLVILNLAVFLIKPLRNWVINVITRKNREKEQDEKLNEILETVKTIAKHTEVQDLALQRLFRNAITDIYYEYKSEKCLPEYMRENLTSLYDSYTKLNGNCYVKTIYEDMLSWDTEE